jgi:putative oxidoreductase
MNQHETASASPSRGCPINGALFGAGTRTVVGDIGLAAMRVGIGLYMAFGHGYGKMFGEDRFGPTEQFIGYTESLGFPAPVLFAWMAAITEFFGGLALALGLLTRPIALAMIGTMVVAAFLAHGDDPWAAKPGERSKEMAMLYLLPSIALLALGGGRLSVDAVLRKFLFCGR